MSGNVGMSPGQMAGGSNSSFSASAGGAYVWADNEVKIGPWSLGFGTRVFKDIAVGAVAVLLVVLGVVMMNSDDIGGALKAVTSGKIVPV